VICFASVKAYSFSDSADQARCRHFSNIKQLKQSGAVGSAPVPAFPETRSGGRYPFRSVSSLPSSSETGRRAGRAVAQSRPGAVCETARGHRTRSVSDV
jgi:hypothetical protein